MTEPYIARKLFARLEREDPLAAAAVRTMQARAIDDWMPLIVHDKGSHAGLLHIVNVGRNVEKMLPGPYGSRLSRGELYFLLTAVLFHDIGRICPQAGRPDWCKVSNCGHQLCAQDPGFAHSTRSREILRDHGYELGLPDDVSIEYTALLSYIHQLASPPRESAPMFGPAYACRFEAAREEKFRNTSIEPYGAVRVPMIAAILRIADETENHWNRAFRTTWLQLLGRAGSPVDKGLSRQSVEDVEYCHAGECIILHLGKAPEPDQRGQLWSDAKKISAAVSRWQGDLHPIGIVFSRVYYRWGGQLHRPMQEEGFWTSDDATLAEVLATDGDDGALRALVAALVGLSRTTMGMARFPWTSVEAHVGRRLTDRDRWLMDMIAERAPSIVSLDDASGIVTVAAGELRSLEATILGGRDGR